MDYYSILNVSPDASYVEIKKNFHQLLLKCHPDKDKSSSAKQQYENIMKAYETLEDENKRKLYDASNNINSTASSAFTNSIISKNNLESMTNKSEQVIYKSQTLNVNICITLEEAYTGCQYPIEVERYIYEDGCRVKEKEKIYITIEEGIDNNEIIIIKNKGHENVDGTFGNIKVFVKVSQHEHFERHGLDLIYNKSLTFEESLCGFNFNIVYLNDKSLCIRNQSGDIILNGSKKVLKGKGMIRNHIVGNLTIRFSIIQPNKIPVHIIDSIRELLKNS
jgi:DnaJ-class molecular chaperone